MPGMSLPLVSRQLLSWLDQALSAEQWIASVKEARLADAVILLSQGLVRATRAHAGLSEWCDAQQVFEIVRTLGSDEIYVLLTEQAKLRLGLMRGFQLILALERSNTEADRRSLAAWLALELCRRQDNDGLQALLERLRRHMGAVKAVSSDEPLPKRSEGPEAQWM